MNKRTEIQQKPHVKESKSKNVLLVCGEVGKGHQYAIDLINVLTEKGAHVHVCANNNMNSTCAPHLSYDMVTLNPNELLHRPALVHCYCLKEKTQNSLELLYIEKACQLLIYVCKDRDNSFEITRPFKFLSVFVLLLNYANVPKVSKPVINNFRVLVATGKHCEAVLSKDFSDKPLTTIFPRFFDSRGPSCRNKLELRQILGLGAYTNKFIFFLDVNEFLELKSVDIVVKAFVNVVQSHPKYRKKLLLLINAIQSPPLENILSNSNVTADILQVFTNYYSDCTKPNTQLLTNLIYCCDCHINPCSGADFDPHCFLSQELGVPLIYHDALCMKEYAWFGDSVQENQLYFDGLSQAFLYLPSIQQIELLIKKALHKLGKAPTEDTATAAIATFRKRNNTFDTSWNNLLNGFLT